VNIFSQTNDYSAVPQQLKDQLNERYPGARRAVLKTGGDFPFLSRPDEVNLYLQVLWTRFVSLSLLGDFTKIIIKTLPATFEASWCRTKARSGPRFHKKWHCWEFKQSEGWRGQFW